MKYLVSLIFTLAMLGGQLSAQENIERHTRYLNRVQLEQELKTKATAYTFAVEDPVVLYTGETIGSTNEPNFYVEKRAVVKLIYSRDLQSDLENYTRTYRVTYRVKQANGNFSANRDIEISISPTQSTVEAVDVELLATDAASAEIEIVEICRSTNAGANFATFSNCVLSGTNAGDESILRKRMPQDIRLELSLEVEKMYHFDPIYQPQLLAKPTYVQGETSEMELRWDFQPGFEYYELEYVFWDKESFDTPIAGTNPNGSGDTEIKQLFKRAVRITTNNNFYTVDLSYPEGMFYSRVRGVGKFVREGTPGARPDDHQLKYSQWSLITYDEISQTNGTTLKPFQPDNNWQQTTSFAEEGKYKKVMSHFDGQLKNRQTLTNISTDQTTLIAETKYDLEGVPALQILPVPIGGTNNNLFYKSGFNKAADNTLYDYTKFDKEAIATQLSASTGAGKYYSSQNASESEHRDYIPNAGGFPFIRTKYLRDGTGRVSAQGGVGQQYQIGNGKATKYYYLNAYERELRRLFGANVGEAKHYRKIITVDANGQASASYQDVSGQVVATSLLGEAPTNVEALASGADPAQSITLDLSEGEQLGEKRTYSFYNTGNTEFTFTVDLARAPLPNSPPGTSPTSPLVCDVCQPRITLELFDECGAPVNWPGQTNNKWVVEIDENNCYTNYPHPTQTKVITLNEPGTYTVVKCFENNTVLQASLISQATNVKNADRLELIEDAITQLDYLACATTCEQEVLMGKVALLLSESNFSTYIDPQEGTFLPGKKDQLINTAIQQTDAELQGANPPCGPRDIDTDTEYQDLIKEAGQNDCEAKLELIKEQLRPGGFYFDPNHRNDIINSLFSKAANVTSDPDLSEEDLVFTVVDVDGVIHQVGYGESANIVIASADDIACTGANRTVTGWTYLVNLFTLNDAQCYLQEQWFDVLVIGHPEYCLYQWCENTASDQKVFDIKIKSIATWRDINSGWTWPSTGSGNLSSPGQETFIRDFMGSDPFFTLNTASCSEDELVDQLRDIDIYNDATNGYDTDDNVFYLIEQYVNYYTANVISLTADEIDELRWELFTGYYLNARNGLPYTANGCSWPGGCEPMNLRSGVTAQEKAAAVFRWEEGPDEFEIVLTEDANGDINSITYTGPESTDFCTDYCVGFADGMLEQLKTLCTVNGTNETAIKNILQTYCNQGCDQVFAGGTITNSSFTIPPQLPADLSGSYEVNGSQVSVWSQISPLVNCPSDVTDRITTYTTRELASAEPCVLDFLGLINDYYRSGSTPCNTGQDPGTSPVTIFLDNNYDEDKDCYSALSKVDDGTGASATTTTFTLDDPEFFTCDRVNIRFYRIGCGTGATGEGGGGQGGTRSAPLPPVGNCDAQNPVPEWQPVLFGCGDEISYTHYADLPLRTNNGLPGGWVYTGLAVLRDDGQEQEPIYMFYESNSDHPATTNPCDACRFIDVGTIDLLCNVIDCMEEALDVAVQQAEEEWQIIVDEFISTSYENLTKLCRENWTKEQTTLSYTDKEYHYTLYYYDQAGNLVQTVPPKGVVPLANDQFTAAGEWIGRTDPTAQNPQHTMVTRYQYNSLNQVVWQGSPDGGTSEFLYDLAQRLRFSRNAEQAQSQGAGDPSGYSYTKYDEHSRIIEVGELGNPTTGWNALSQSIIGTAGDFPTSSDGELRDITYTHYNETDLSRLGTSFSQENMRGRVAWTATQTTFGQSPAPYDAETYYTYDAHGNVKSMINKLKDMDNFEQKTDYSYDLVSGNVKEVAYQSGAIDQFYHRYNYDADNRLTGVYTSENGRIWDQDARYYYYAHGPLARMEVGQDKVQGCDYYYTLQGWIKGVNTSSFETSLLDLGKDGNIEGAAQRHQWIGRDEVAYGLGYNANDYSPINNTVDLGASAATNWNTFSGHLQGGQGLYNGNIAWMVTTLKQAAVDDVNAASTRAMVYKYDQLHRIKRAKSYQTTNTNTVSWAADGKFDTEYSYDPNGNLLSLDRVARINGTAQAIDQLTYHYPDPEKNLLGHVSDVLGNTSTPLDVDTQNPNNYWYDEIGNITRDNQAGASISWTVYGKVRSVNKEGDRRTDFFYDASGNRILKQVYLSNGTLEKQTAYARDASGNVLAVYEKTVDNSYEIHQKEVPLYGSSRLGMRKFSDRVLSATPSDAPFLATRGNKFFELSNHLGNVLSVVSDRKLGIRLPSNPKLALDYYAADVVSYTDYYPFGLEMPGRKGSNGSGYRYGFNGKEKDESGEWGSLTHYDYGFRIYNPGIGKFLSVDPLARSFPWNGPYNYAENSPVAFIDLDGAERLYVSNVGTKDAPKIHIDRRDYWETQLVQVHSGMDNHRGEIIPIQILNPRVEYIDADLMEQTHALAVRQQYERQRQIRKAQADLARLKAKNSNPLYVMSHMTDVRDYLDATAMLISGHPKEAAAIAGLALLPEVFEQGLRVISKSFRRSGGVGAINGYSGNIRQDLRKINHTADGIQRGYFNCVGCALATDALLKGRAATALGDEFADIYAAGRDLKSFFGKPETLKSFKAVSDKLKSLGDGTTSILTVNGNPGHAFNAVNDNGVIRVFDGQSGTEITKDQLPGYLDLINPSRGSIKLYNTTGK